MALTAKKVYAILKRQISDMEAKLNSPVRYRGTVATADLLPLNPDIGDMYNIESKSVYGEAGMNVAWNGVVWDTMGAPIDMSLYLTKEEAEAVIQRLVTEYFEKNPVKPGATTEQAQQIEQNKTDIASLKTETSSLKEDLSTKITKFYASSQGETHLADSDNGKIMDMMLYGKSEQKQYSGKNLLNATMGTTTENGITCTANDDGTFTLNGTATASFVFIIIKNDDLKKAFGTNEELRLTGAPKGASKTGYYLQIWKNEPEVIYRDTGGGVTAKKPNASCNVAIVIVNGVVCNNVLFKPMLTTDLTATYDDFEPYTGGIPSPNPDYPQEIKSVVNPTVKVCGKNLLNPTFKTNTYSGVALTNNGDGTYTIEGTNNSSGELIFPLVPTVDEQKALYNSLIGKNVKFIVESGSTISGSVGRICFVFYNRTENRYSSEIYNGGNVTVPTGYDLSVVDIHINVGQTVPKTILKPMITTDLTATYDDFEPYHEQTVTIPYTLNAIPVNSGGNITIDGQQYIADYVDVERGKLVRKIKEISKDPIVLVQPTNNPSKKRFILGSKFLKAADNFNKWSCKCSNLQTLGVGTSASYGCVESCGIDTGGKLFVYYEETSGFTTAEEFKAWWGKRDIQLMGILETPIEIDLTPEEIAASKALATYYPVTNISINSEQLDGYTVFNYPISMANGWNYVKQQIGDTRDYIYDMDARTQDTDLQAAEAYVNSEYAVALTELEV